MTSTPFVDVAVPTYNHERYIATTIESILEQKTDFPYRLIIGDDCSSDSTQSIIRRYAQKYPDLILPVLYSKHLGPFHKDRVWLKTLSLCTAKYIAVVDGDDYWTDPLKLQKQADYLEAHPDCVLCFHNARLVFDQPSEFPVYYCLPDQKEVSHLVDIVNRCFLIPCTVLFRNHVLPPLPKCFYKVGNGDWMLFVMLAEHGYLGYLNEVMADYRVHSDGYWQGLKRPEQLRMHVKTYTIIDEYLNHKFADLVGGHVSALRDELDRLAAAEKELARQRARTSLDDYHSLARHGQMSRALASLLAAIRSDPSSVMHPHRAAAVVKNGLLGVLASSRHRNALKEESGKDS